MKPKTGALAGIFAAHGLLGVSAVWSSYGEQNGGVLAHVLLACTSFLAGLFPFAWIIYDRRERGLPRSGWFNVALAYIPALVAPIYAWRTRPRGQRLKIIAAMFGVMLGAYALAIVVVIFAMIVTAIVAGFATA